MFVAFFLSRRFAVPIADAQLRKPMSAFPAGPRDQADKSPENVANPRMARKMHCPKQQLFEPTTGAREDASPSPRG
jgi:hypothetical protein